MKTFASGTSWARSGAGRRVGTWIRPGTCGPAEGLWRRHTANGYTATALAPATLTDIGGGACFNDARGAGGASGGPKAGARREPDASGGPRRPVAGANPGQTAYAIPRLSGGVESVPSANRPRPPWLTCPPLRPARRASSGVHSCAVPFSVCCAPTLAGDLALPLRTHRRETARSLRSLVT